MRGSKRLRTREGHQRDSTTQKKDNRTQLSSKNRYEVLQLEEEAEIETQPMDYQEKGKEISSSQAKTTPKQKAQIDLKDKDEQVAMETTIIEIDPSKGEELSIEEEVLNKFLNEWRHLDERFILEHQKKLYKEAFKQYKSKQGQG